jgi:hypothetical protein
VRDRPWSSAARSHRPVMGLLLIAFVFAAAGPILAAAPADEDELFRQMKVDVFDGNWSAVLRTAEEILAGFPDGTAATQAAYQRARALSHLPGREADATAAYRDFIARHPDEGLLVEQAWTGIFSLACDGRRQASAGCVAALSEGLSRPLPYVSTLAAIRASDTNDPPLRRRALAALKGTLRTQDDPDIRNEILIAILKIDPREVPQPTPPPGAPPAPRAPGAPPTLIRLSVFNKATQRYEVRINVPVAFAQMLVDALGDDEKQELRDEAKRRGIDLDDIFAAIRKSGSGRFLDVDTEDSRIEVWIE